MKDDILKEARERMTKTIESIGRDFASVRTGKATTNMLDPVKVEAYGTSMPLNQVASISAPEPRLLLVQAFDKTTVGEIVKGIQRADLGLNPTVDGQLIRLPIPALNEERRKELVKHCKGLAEEGRVAVRNIRRDANDAYKAAEKSKEISEDQMADGQDDVQTLTNEFIEKIDEMLEKKEIDVMEV